MNFFKKRKEMKANTDIILLLNIHSIFKSKQA